MMTCPCGGTASLPHGRQSRSLVRTVLFHSKERSMVAYDTNLSTSISLIDRARSQEAEAWAMLTRLYGPLIYSWARRSGLPAEDAADILQNVLMAVWKGLPSFIADQADSSFRGWLRTITRNAVHEWARRGARRIAADSLEVDYPAPEISEDDGPEGLFGGLTQQALQLARGSADERTWDAFWKCTMEDMAVSDVAKLLEMSPAAVRQAKYRVLCRLRELLVDR